MMLRSILMRKSTQSCLFVMLVMWFLLIGECCAKTFVYSANTDAQTIAVFELNESNGYLSHLQNMDVGGAVMPMTIAKNAENNYVLFAATRSAPFKLIVMDIDFSSGKLTAKATAPLADNMANIALDRDKKFLFAASYSGNKISLQSLDATIPSDVIEVMLTGKNPHQITADPENKFVYVSLLGDDRLDYFHLTNTVQLDKTSQLERSAQKLQRVGTIKFPSGSGPRHFVFSANGKFLYVIAELSAQVHVLVRDKYSGKLTLVETHDLLPKKSGLKPWAADIHLTPNGKFLYASERSSNRLFSYRVDSQTGKLEKVGSWKTEKQPRSFAISPDGRYLVAAGQISNRLHSYMIHSATGELKQIHSITTGTNPSWVEIIQLCDN
jgi:6-phosphogluconolactonase